MNAKQFIEKLESLKSEEQRRKTLGYFKTGAGDYAENSTFIGVRMGVIFSLAKEYVGMEAGEIERLLESPIHEARVGAVSIMDFEARSKKTPETRRRELFDLYINRHDRINNWDLVDRAAPSVIGGYLFDKPRDVLYRLARSENLWERRTAIVSTFYFIRHGQLDDTFNIAEILLHDPHDLIHKAVGGWLRAAGTKDKARLAAFLTLYAAEMPRTMLRFSLEHFDKSEREYFMKMKDGR